MFFVSKRIDFGSFAQKFWVIFHWVILSRMQDGDSPVAQVGAGDHETAGVAGTTPPVLDVGGGGDDDDGDSNDDDGDVKLRRYHGAAIFDGANDGTPWPARPRVPPLRGLAPLIQCIHFHSLQNS